MHVYANRSHRKLPIRGAKARTENKSEKFGGSEQYSGARAAIGREPRSSNDLPLLNSNSVFHHCWSLPHETDSPQLETSARFTARRPVRPASNPIPTSRPRPTPAATTDSRLHTRPAPSSASLPTPGNPDHYAFTAPKLNRGAPSVDTNTKSWSSVDSGIHAGDRMSVSYGVELLALLDQREEDVQRNRTVGGGCHHFSGAIRIDGIGSTRGGGPIGA